MAVKILAGALLVAAIGFLLDAFYIKAKAELAQMLISRAFDRAIIREAPVLPWHWADTWPIARLESTRLDEDVYILAGAHGSALAFGPGHVDGTVAPGLKGTSVVAGHRDTHFRFLQHLVGGDVLKLQDQRGRWSTWIVEAGEIVDTGKRPALEIEPDANSLILVTCYPFDAVRPGGDLRFVITARAATPGLLPALPSARFPSRSSSSG